MSAPKLAGRLEDEPLPGLLHQLHHAQATGVLRLDARAGRHEVFVREGFPVAVNLPGSAELLGKVLVEMNILDEETHKRTLAQPPPKGTKYGEWLVEQKLVSIDHMKLALKAQVRRKLHRLFFLNDGQFAFADGTHHEGMEGHDSLRIHPARAIYQGVRSAWNAERLAGALFLLEGRAIKCTADETAVARYGIGPDDGKVAELLRKGYWAMPDLIEASRMQMQPVHALVYALYVTEVLDIKGVDEVPRLKRREASLAGPLPTAETSGARPLPTETSGARRLPTETSGARRLPTETSVARKLPSGVEYPMLRGVPAGTPPRGVPPGSLPGAVRGMPLVTDGSGARPLPAASDPDSMRKQIDAKARVVETEDLFSVLGLPQTADKEQVKVAYFDAAKRYHPDRLTSLGLEALRPEVEKIFRRVSEAYGSLYDDERREEYRKTLGKPSEQENPEVHAKAMRMLEAEMAFRRGEALLRKNDYVGAIAEFEASVTGNPQEGEHLAWLTWARVSAGQMSFTDAKPRFVESTRLSPKCARAFYFLGLALKEEGDLDRALSMFRKARDIDQRLLEAEREMRLINMRKDKQSGRGGFLDRFRKK